MPAALLVVSCIATTTSAVNEQEVVSGIEAMKGYLFKIQSDQGHWEVSSVTTGHEGGQTALVVLSLLIAGESHQNPRLSKALDWLKQAHLSSTYAVSLRAHVWSGLPNEFHPWLRRDADWLMEAAKQHELGTFDYQSHRSTRIDNSVTQYGTLGLWEAAKRGVPVPDRFWQALQTHFLSSQQADGGWDYDNTSDPTGSMTAAGLTALIICRQQLYQSKRIPEPLTGAVDRGLAWLNRHFDGPRNPPVGSWNYYYLVSIERVALAGGIRALRGRDWYRVGARYILDQQEADDSRGTFGSVGRQPWQTAFALMFLSRGSYPVWVSKLSVPNLRWNSRPDDMHRLTSYLSDVAERELNWQVVSVQTAPEHWINAPVLYLASSDAVELTKDQQQRLKRYLDLGGLLLANPVGRSTRFTASVRRLAVQLYPRFRMRPLDREHPMFSSLHRLSGKVTGPVHGVSNGVRELMILLDRDWSASLQSATPGVAKGSWPLATNLFVYVTDRGRIPDRLASSYEQRLRRVTEGQILLGRLRYDGEWLPEPAGWQQIGNRVFNRFGLNVQTVDLELEALSANREGPDLAHLAGVESVKLNELELAAIERYAHGGGTILVETVGGRGDFAVSVEKQLAERFGTAAVPISNRSAVLSGEDIPGAEQIRRVRYRRRATAVLSARSRPRLAAFHLKGRPAVIISREDLTLGVMGVRHWDVLGYDVESARRLAMNLLLWCHAQRAQVERERGEIPG